MKAGEDNLRSLWVMMPTESGFVAMFVHSTEAEFNSLNSVFHKVGTDVELSPSVAYQRRWTDVATITSISVSSVEIKPATDGRNDPASESCIRCDEKRGIFLLNKPDTNELRRVLVVEKNPLYHIIEGGGFFPLLLFVELSLTN